MAQYTQQNNHDFDEFSSSAKDDFILEPIFLILQKWRFILSFMLIFTLITGTYIYLKPNTYEAKVTLMVSSGDIYSVKSLENEEILRNQKLVATYTEIAKNQALIVDTLEKLDMERDPEEVYKLLELFPVGDTELIQITFKDENPQLAARFVNEISRAFIDKIESVMTFENLKVVDQARIPDKPTNKKKLLFLLSLISGYFMAIFIVIGSEIFRGKLKDPKDFENILEAQVLGNIPELKEMRKGEKYDQ